MLPVDVIDLPDIEPDDIVPLVTILPIDDMSHCNVHIPTPVCVPTENPPLFLITPSIKQTFEQSTPFGCASRYMVFSLPLKRTKSLLMIINVPAVVSVLVVIVLLDMLLVDATDAADTGDKPVTVNEKHCISPVDVVAPFVEILPVDYMSHCDVHIPTPVCAPTENPPLCLITLSV